MASFVRTLLNRAPVPYTGNRRSSGLSWGSGSSSSRTAQMQAMGSVGTLFSIVNRTSNATAQVEWKLYRKAANGSDDERVEVTSHAALDLWNKPNPFMPRQEFVESFQQHVDLTGEAWWVIYRDPRATIPLELWPVRPDRMEPVPAADNFLAGYIYTGPDGEKVPLALDEVIFLRMPNPLDIYRGMGPVQSILTDLDASRYSAEWNRNFFLNSAEPGGVIAVDRRLDDDEFEEMRLRWAEQHRGVAAAHRVAIIEQGAQWVDRKFTQRDMQFAELRSVSRDVIREAFGMPAFALGEVADVNRATADASRVWFAEQMTVPRLERIKGALNFDLLPLYGTTGQGLEFDYCSPVPDDEEAENAELTAKANAAAVLVEAGWQPDAVLNAVGLPAMPYTGPIGAAPQPVQPVAHLRARQHRSHRLQLRDSADADLEDVRADYERALASLTATWDAIEDAWIRHLEDQIADAIDGDDTAALASLTVDTGDAVHALRRALAAMASQAADRLVQEAGAQGVHITAPALDSALTNRAPQAGILRASYGSDLVDVATVTATLLASGLSASAAREALRLMRPDAVGRSVATAVGNALRTAKGWFRRDQLGAALHRAQNAGRLAAIDAGPPGPVITATEVHDGNRCGPCSDIDGTEFASVDEAEAAYGTGGYIDCDGGIRCRGTVVAMWPGGG
jgi:HK97 family phage portal protein